MNFFLFWPHINNLINFLHIEKKMSESSVPQIVGLFDFLFRKDTFQSRWLTTSGLTKTCKVDSDRCPSIEYASCDLILLLFFQSNKAPGSKGQYSNFQHRDVILTSIAGSTIQKTKGMEEPKEG
jgi:hypothetical protein